MKRTLSLVLLALWLAPVQAHEGHAHEEEAPVVGAAGLARLPDGSVNVPKATQRRLAVRTLVSEVGEAAATLQLPARVVMDPNRSGRVQAVYGG
ncbi:MAG TPA: hypothetical protein DDX06_04285, partial [Curvibacter sp.]|nr:hypothetical protein [Curvibacter sp.]